jgi:hypothetical protein
MKLNILITLLTLTSVITKLRRRKRRVFTEKCNYFNRSENGKYYYNVCFNIYGQNTIAMEYQQQVFEVPLNDFSFIIHEIDEKFRINFDTVIKLEHNTKHIYMPIKKDEQKENSIILRTLVLYQIRKVKTAVHLIDNEKKVLLSLLQLWENYSHENKLVQDFNQNSIDINKLEQKIVSVEIDPTKENKSWFSYIWSDRDYESMSFYSNSNYISIFS